MSFGKTIQGALSYNERKVSKGEARLLAAEGFPVEAESLGFTAKLNRFTALTELTPKTQTNTLHLSLNFPPGEELSDAQMKSIAADYMYQIGFGEQPFLVYRHIDAHHPHIHIVTTTIRDNGDPIPLHNLGKDRSEPARKAIEQEYGLIVASSRGKQVIPTFAAERAPILYGQDQVKHAITNVLGFVVQSFKFTNLAELNIILRHYNVVADRGSVNSRMYQSGGLVYSLLDKEGERIGCSIKASDIYNSPTLKKLNKRFTANAGRKAATLNTTRSIVSEALQTAGTARRFTGQLKHAGIRLHFDQDRLGIIKNVFFVDHVRRAVYDHRELSIKLNDIYSLRAVSQLSTPKKNIEPSSTTSKATDGGPVLGFGTHSTNMVMQILFSKSSSAPGAAGDPPRKKKKRRPPL